MQALTRYNANTPVVFSEMNKTLGEIEARDNEQQKQINVLEGLVNGIKIYKSISELGLSAGANMKEIGKAMKDNTRLITFMRKSDYSESATNYGILEVTRVSANYISYIWRTSISSSTPIVELYVAHYHTQSDVWTGWKPISTTTKADISLLNGWVNYDGANAPLRAIRNGNVVNIIGRIKDGVMTKDTVIATLPNWGTYKFTKGYVIALDGSDNKIFEVNVTVNGQINCQGTWTSVPYGYIFNFSVDLA